MRARQHGAAALRVSPLHPATTGLDPDAQDFVSPGCVCPKVYATATCWPTSVFVCPPRCVRRGRWGRFGKLCGWAGRGGWRLHGALLQRKTDSSSTWLPQPPGSPARSLRLQPELPSAAEVSPTQSEGWSVQQEASTSASLLQVS